MPSVKIYNTPGSIKILDYSGSIRILSTLVPQVVKVSSFGGPIADGGGASTAAQVSAAGPFTGNLADVDLNMEAIAAAVDDLEIPDEVASSAGPYTFVIDKDGWVSGDLSSGAITTADNQNFVVTHGLGFDGVLDVAVKTAAGVRQGVWVTDSPTDNDVCNLDFGFVLDSEVFTISVGARGQGQKGDTGDSGAVTPTDKEASETFTVSDFDSNLNLSIRDIDASTANTYTLPVITENLNKAKASLSKTKSADPVLAANAADNMYSLSHTSITLESFGANITVEAVYDSGGDSFWMLINANGEINPS